MKTQQRKDFRTSVILSEDQHLKLNAIALKKDVSVAWVIRQAISKMLDDTEYAGDVVQFKKVKKQG